MQQLQTFDSYNNFFSVYYSDVLKIVHGIKRQSEPSRTPARRRLEYETQKDKKINTFKARNIESYVSEYRMKTAYSNYARCMLCKCNLLESSCEVVDPPILLLDANPHLGMPFEERKKH